MVAVAGDSGQKLAGMTTRIMCLLLAMIAESTLSFCGPSIFF
jgi:hypothetical protein